MTIDELRLLMELLEMLRIKTKTDALYHNVQKGISIIQRELDLKNISSEYGKEK